MNSFLQAVWRRINKKKHVDITDTKTELIRCLSLGRLVLIGIGKTVGIGIYVLIGVATKEYAGPSVILSFLIGFLVTLLNGLCFAEYASRNPRTGAQYTYMYETLGEGMAFIVGWTSILGFTSACSLAARGWSGYLDSMFDHAIQNFTVNHIANWTRGSPYPDYPDFPAIFIVIFVMVVTSIGVNYSTIINSILAGVSGNILIFITVYGFYYADIKNWFNDHGGFFPYGLRGVLKASSACFYAYQGFEILGLSAEEAVNPAKTIPLAIVLTLIIVTLLYLGVAVSFTLMIPYAAVNTNAPFPGAFQYHSVTWAKYLVAIGPIFALANLCSLELFTLQRLAYSMSSDGLLFSVLSKVNKVTKVPLGPTLAFGPVVLGLILCIDLSSLIGFMVTYTFLQYSLFAAYMIVLRYEAASESTSIGNVHESHRGDNGSIELSVQNAEDGHISTYDPPETTGCIDAENQQIDLNDNSCMTSVNLKDVNSNGPDKAQRNIDSRNWLQLYLDNTLKTCKGGKVRISQWVILVYVASFLLAIQLVQGIEDVWSGQWLALLVTGILAGIIVLAALAIWCQEQKGESDGFLVPLMPFLPVACLFFNMMMLVSIAEKGSLLASFILATVGVVVYLVIVLYDLYKGDREGGCTPVQMECVRLLAQEQDMDIHNLGEETEEEETWN